MCLSVFLLKKIIKYIIVNFIMVFTKGQKSWNKGTKGIMKPNKTSFKKGDTAPRTAFKKGMIPWNKGKKGFKIPKETKIKIRKNHFRYWLGKKRPKMSKEKHPNWKGGITPLSTALKQTSNYKIWRELVFLRDNFTCQNPNCEFCDNKIGAMFHPHHIKPLSLFPELAFDINNGITYCAEYHLKSKLHRGLKCRFLSNQVD